MIVIKDSVTGRYYDGANPRFPSMGGTRETATRFDDRVSAGMAMMQMPLTVLVESEELES